MKEEQPKSSETRCVQFEENAACEVCGQFGAYPIGDRKLCQNCYQGSGSCCPEFGKDDLWRFPDES